jgi:hypothetical protein
MKNRKIDWGLLAGLPILIWGMFTPHKEWADLFGVSWPQIVVLIILVVLAFRRRLFKY